MPPPRMTLALLISTFTRRLGTPTRPLAPGGSTVEWGPQTEERTTVTLRIEPSGLAAIEFVESWEPYDELKRLFIEETLTPKAHAEHLAHFGPWMTPLDHPPCLSYAQFNRLDRDGVCNLRMHLPLALDVAAAAVGAVALPYAGQHPLRFNAGVELGPVPFGDNAPERSTLSCWRCGASLALVDFADPAARDRLIRTPCKRPT